MDKIDRDWIRKRLQEMPRGSQKRLAEHLGIPDNMMSKIMSGVRSLQQDEIPKVLSFFNARIVIDRDPSPDQQYLLEEAQKLNDDGLRLLKAHLKHLLEVDALRREPAEPKPGSERHED
jgi:transcriptional regulator with XRE-family HTH domain